MTFFRVYQAFVKMTFYRTQDLIEMTLAEDKISANGVTSNPHHDVTKKLTGHRMHIRGHKIFQMDR